jgi:hypothetical protein
MLVDVSEAARSEVTARLYAEEANLVIDQVAAEKGLLVADAERPDALASDTTPVDVAFASVRSAPNPVWERTRTQHEVDRAHQEVRSLLTAPASSAPDDLIGSLRVAERVFAAHPNATGKRLVVLSPMADPVVSTTLDTDSSPTAVDSMIARWRTAGTLPNFSGVTVNVGGAGLDHGGGSRAADDLAVERFWLQFMRAAGATLSAADYTTRFTAVTAMAAAGPRSVQQ